MPLTVTALLLAAAICSFLQAHPGPRRLGWALAVAFFGGALAAFGDALSRHAEYRRVRRMLTRHGFDRRVLDAMASSRCQRDAALCAAGEAGFWHEATAHYRSLGYRWHHLLPDGWRSRPWMLVAPKFLKKSFLAFGRVRPSRAEAASCAHQAKR